MLTDIGQFSELCLSPLLYISPQQPCADAAAENTCHRDCQGIQSEDRKSSDNLRIAAYLYAEQEQKQPNQYRNGLGRPRTVTLSQKRTDDDTAQHETYDSKHIPTNYYPILNVIKLIERYLSLEDCKPNARYPHPKSLPSGKGLALAHEGSKSSVSQVRSLIYLSVIGL